MADKTKEDCPLACGYEAIEKGGCWWRYRGKDLAIKIWFFFSIPLLAVLIWGKETGRLTVHGLWAIPLAVLYVVGIGGLVCDIVLAIVSAEEAYTRKIRPKIKKQAYLVHLADRLITFTLKLLFVAGSPVFAVWLAAARHSGELALYSSDARIGLYFIGLVAAIGCCYDINRLVGAEIKQIWKNQDKNLIGCFKRLLIRAIGHGYIAAGRCEIIKRSTR